jgi:predicted PurR-regulated permease PerM
MLKARRTSAERGSHESHDLRREADASTAARTSEAEASVAVSGTTPVANGSRGLSLAVWVLAVLALLYTLFVARVFLLPICFAVLLSFLLSPLVRSLGRLKLPLFAGAAIVVLALLGVLVAGAYVLATPVQKWLETAPTTLTTLQSKIGKVMKPVQRVTKTAEQVQQQATETGPKATAVVVQGPSLTSKIFGTTQRILTSVLEVLILLFFLLAAGDLFFQKLIKVLPNISDKKKAVRIARDAKSSISGYLATVATINVAEGLVVAGVMALLGMPTPGLWGALVAMLEFIPYLGAATAVVVLGVTALTTFDSLGHALLVPGSFLLINMVQANVVSPFVLGNRLSLNPVAVFVGLMYWYWIWGVPGAFIAVPLLATFKICCDHIEVLQPIGEFLGRRDDS